MGTVIKYKVLIYRLYNTISLFGTEGDGEGAREEGSPNIWYRNFYLFLGIFIDKIYRF